MKKILWKSDLWFATLTFAALTAFCLVFLIIHLVQGEAGEAFAMGIVAAIPGTIALFLAFTDRSDARRVWVHPHVERDMLERSGLFEESFMNPKNPVNAERIARAKDPKRPPDIG